MGPLNGVRILEIAGLGAAPYGCMMLADMGADVVRVERPTPSLDAPPGSPLRRNRRSICLDLKKPADLETALALAEQADVLVEAFRPGVAERLGIGPEVCRARNPRLVYARMTGWGQDGPLAPTVGHDLNYIGLTGLLHQIGPRGGPPVVPMNVIGDFGGGGLLMAYGVVCALLEARQSGQGQVVDAAMVDGALSFMAMSFGYRLHGLFDDRTGTHLLSGGAHYYGVYETLDGKAMAVASIEPAFYRALIDTLQLDPARWLPAGLSAVDRTLVDEMWPALRVELEAIFRTRTQAEWCAVFDSVEACVTPVLSLADAARHPHHQARGSFIEVDGVEQQAPAPRFSRTAPAPPRAPPKPGSDAETVFRDWGVAPPAGS